MTDEISDVGKVLKGLKICRGCGVCTGCPYETEDFDLAQCTSELCKDAYELLKKMKPEEPDEMYIGRVKVNTCPNCKDIVHLFAHHCETCGQAIKWDAAGG